MGEVRFKTTRQEDEIIDNVCQKMGWKRADLGRQALNEYLKSLSVISQRVKEKD